MGTVLPPTELPRTMSRLLRLGENRGTTVVNTLGLFTTSSTSWLVLHNHHPDEETDETMI